MREKDVLQIPKARKSYQDLMIHNDKREDPYFWMRLTDEQKEATNPDAVTKEVLAYLEAENTYYKDSLIQTDAFQEKLFEEMKGRVKEEDSSVPYKKRGFLYNTHYQKGMQYPVYKRRNLEISNANEEVLLDVNKLAEPYEYYAIGGLSVSPNNSLLAYSFDSVSRRQYTIVFKDLQQNKMIDVKIENTTGNIVWANDNQTVFYTKKDPVTLRSNAVYRHVLGTPVSEDVEVYLENDETFNVFVTKSKSEAYIMIGSYSTLSTEYRYLCADKPLDEFKVFQKRQKDLEYSISHYDKHFYIHTNIDGAKNFKLMQCGLDHTEKENWTDLLAHREDVLLEDLTIFKNYLVLEERCQGLNQIRIKSWDGTVDYLMPFNEETYTCYVSTNPEFDTETLRYVYNSMTTPSSVIDFNMSDKTFEVKKEQEVLGGTFDKENYLSKRIWVTARDGKQVAVSMVYHKTTALSKETPLLLYAYGSYGHTIDDQFSSTRLSLLDRGFVYAIAHVRGSEYLGRAWYEDGKLLNKKNTFYDFIDCSQFLIDKNYTSAQHLYAMGGSAGGLLMGAVINMAPNLYNGVVAAVPFVDVVSTMLDETIPLTTGEYDEWGNPNDPDYYDYIKSYSPYDNVTSQSYPNLLVTTGYFDSQVQYWEPAKWVAKLRDYHTGNQKIYLHTDLKTGHGGPSGRFDALKDIARDYVFLLDLEQIRE